MFLVLRNWDGVEFPSTGLVGHRDIGRMSMVSLPRTLVLAVFERTCLRVSYDTGLCIPSLQLVGAGLLPDEVGFSP
jgi:hypothetical protein